MKKMLDVNVRKGSQGAQSSQLVGANGITPTSASKHHYADILERFVLHSNVGGFKPLPEGVPTRLIVIQGQSKWCAE
jgi:hypothetical protein